MPRQQTYRTWQQEDLIAALQSIKADGLSINAAAKTYGIPSSTLRDKFHGRSKISTRPGPTPFLSEAEEEKIVDWAIKMGRMGLRQTRVDIQNVVKTLVDKDGRETPFVNNTPGGRWWRSFVRRHPNIIYRKQQPTDKARVMVSDQRIEAWFRDFEARLQKERALSMFSEPHRLFDDESESPLDGILSGFSAPQPPAHRRTPSQAHHSPSTSTTVAFDGILNGFSAPQSTPAQPVGSTPSTPAFTAQTPPGPEASVSQAEYLVVPIGMSGDQRKKKGLPPAAITVAEFFRYMRARRTRENREEKVEQTRINRQISLKMDLDEEQEMEEDNEEDEEVVMRGRQEGWEEIALTTPQTEQEREERKEQVAEGRKKMKEKRKKQKQILKNKQKVNELMKSAHEPDSEVKRRQLKEEKEKARKINQKRKEEKKKNEERLRKDTIIEAKDKVRTKSNIKTVASDKEIYVCPVCLKSSIDNEKWISCDHCIRWMHLSCTSMHLLRGIDLAGFDYKCKFC